MRETPSPTRVCVFAKPPYPGEVKTRLIPALGATGAARLAAAFIEDTVKPLLSVDWANPVLASTGPMPRALAELLAGVPVWNQGVGDLGKRVERILRRGLESAPGAIALGADSPGLPPARLAEAREAMERGTAVVGPCEDGGFYLLGLAACPPGILEGIPWSESSTCESTLARLREAGQTVELLEPWFDVDRMADLDRLISLAAAGSVSAPRTVEVARSLLGRSESR